MNCSTHIAFHGVRGSSPVSGVPFAVFGGDTPCVEIASAETRLFVDAGSGLRNVRTGPDIPADLDLILSHYHYDHLVGLPFFEPAWRENGRLRVWAPKFGSANPIDILETFFFTPYCPVSLDTFRTRVEVIPYVPGESWSLDHGVGVSTMLADHPGGCAAIRLSTRGGDIVYASDVEVANPKSGKALVEFSSEASLIIIDAMNDDSNTHERRGWGHSSWREALAVAAAAEAREIALFHHDPRRTDETLSALDAVVTRTDARAFLVRQGSRFDLSSTEVANGVPSRTTREETAPWRCSR